MTHSFVDAEDDLTVSVILRLRFSSAETSDFQLCLQSLHLFIGNHRDMERSISDYRSRHPVPSCLIDRIVRGTPGMSERRFVSKAGERLPTLSSFGLCSILQLLVSLMAQLSLESSHRLELLRAVSSSSSLLPYLFSVLNGVAKVKPDYGCQPDLVASIITDLLLSVISKVAMDYPELSEAFMRICGRAGLVEAIEAAFVQFPQRSILSKFFFPCAD